jgi:hypothetical protein
MDTARIRREVGASLRLLATGERRLLVGALALVLGYAVWVGATGAALNFGLNVGDQPASVAAWQATSTLVLALLLVFWILIPAGVGTYLTSRALTNANGNIRQQYRVHHPFLLAAPFLAIVVAGVATAIALGTLPAAVLAVLSACSLYALVRTVAASYRVFSLSRPLLTYTSLFVSLAATAVAIPASAATLTGRQAIVDAAAAGLSNKLGTGAVETFLTGSTAVAGTSVSLLLAATVVLPAGSSILYFATQAVVGVVNRARDPEVRGAQLRTGQRHPDFAKPSYDDTASAPRSQSASASTPTNGTVTTKPSGSTTATSASSNGKTSATATDSVAETTASDEPADDADETDEDDVSHTKVFKPPSDDDLEMESPEAPGGGGSVGGTTGENTAVVSEDGYVCPSCDDRFGADASFDYCPTCGSELENA